MRDAAQPALELREEPATAIRGTVARVEDAPVANNPVSLIDAIIRAASDPAVDADKVERLFAIHERILAQAAKAAFTAAFADLQPKLPTIDQNGAIKNTAGAVQSNYAKWEDINDAIKPLLDAHGFALSFRPGSGPEGRIAVTTILAHVEGHQEEATVTLPNDSSGGKNNVQGVGSALSYGKRYGAISILNITSRAPADRDDDGRGTGFGEIAQRAMAEINLADTVEQLREWKTAKYDGLSKILEAHELKEVVALYNRRIKAAREAAAQTGRDDRRDDR